MNFDNRTTELIALGASVAANCHPCIQHHKAKAVEAGLTPEEIRAAMEVGRTVRKGAAASMDKLVASLNEESTAVSMAPSCACG
ncbi:MAG: carboxymuconolactone decarboxylase family protein [Negativicutes bacterium]|nr:carboxymuconolactone decarboxylase family protein [Negativicutes bacterium]